MASEPKYYGKIDKIPFEGMPRTDSFGEAHIVELEITGQFDDIIDEIRPGQTIPTNYIKSLGTGSWYVKNVQFSREDGNVCTAKVSIVDCPKGLHEPFAEQWEVSMDAVSHKLLQHELFKKDGKANTKVLNWIMKWEDTAPRLRTYEKQNGDTGYQFENPDGDVPIDEANGIMGTRPDTSDEDGKKFAAYCKAVLAGIETYNEYLPVVRHTSQYLRIPGGNYSTNGVCTGGSVQGLDLVGKFDNPDMTIAGNQFKNGRWFKSRDTFSVNSDGTATRNEEWTYFRDLSHLWIYSDDPDSDLD